MNKKLTASIRRIFLAAILLICLLFSVCACSKRTDVAGGESYILCLNTDRTGLVKVSFTILSGDTEEAAEAVLAELQSPSTEIEYTQAIPNDVEVQSCELSGSILYVDFSSQYLSVDRIEEKLMRAAVVQSLVRIDGINAVSFAIEGEPLKDEAGNMVGLMNGDDFVENTVSSPSSYHTDTLVLYFANEKGDKLVKQTVDVRHSSNVSKEKLIVEKMLQGPVGTGASPTINPQTNLLGVSSKDKICYVNFDDTFLTGTYDVLPEVTIYSLVNSLIEGTDAEMVQITINGETSAVYMGVVDLSRPLRENLDWVAAEDEE